MATPTAAPTSVTVIRSHPADSASSEPTPSTSIALIATSMRLDRSRRAVPISSDVRISTPRLHQVRGTTVEKTTARVTPETTATTRSRPAASRLTGVTCTTSRAVRGASSGCVPAKITEATR